jgi:hypothetical protein
MSGILDPSRAAYKSECEWQCTGDDEMSANRVCEVQKSGGTVLTVLAVALTIPVDVIMILRSTHCIGRSTGALLELGRCE